MKLTFALPALNWHDPQQLPPLHTPAFNQCCRFGRFVPQASNPSAFFARYLWQGSLREQALATLGLPAHTPALFASPLWQQMGMHQMATLSGNEIGISEAEATELCQGLTSFYAAEGWRVYPYRADLWLITLPALPHWSASPVLDILGQVDGTMRAEGQDERLWLSWQTEMQMWLHNHAVNQARQHRQVPPINGVWLWQDCVGEQKANVLTVSNSVWANAHCIDAPYDWAAWQTLLAEHSHAVHHAVIFLDDLLTARHTADVWAYQTLLQQWEERFFAPAWHSLTTGQLSQLNLASDGAQGGVLHIHAKAHWAFWKKKQSFRGSLNV